MLIRSACGETRCRDGTQRRRPRRASGPRVSRELPKHDGQRSWGKLRGGPRSRRWAALGRSSTTSSSRAVRPAGFVRVAALGPRGMPRAPLARRPRRTISTIGRRFKALEDRERGSTAHPGRLPIGPSPARTGSRYAPIWWPLPPSGPRSVARTARRRAPVARPAPRPSTSSRQARRSPTGLRSRRARASVLSTISAMRSRAPRQPRELRPAGGDRPQPLQVAGHLSEAPRLGERVFGAGIASRARIRPRTVNATIGLIGETSARIGICAARSPASAHRPCSNRTRASHAVLYRAVPSRSR